MDDGLAYVFASYGIVLAVLVIWIWMLARRVADTVQRLEADNQQDRSGTP